MRNCTRFQNPSTPFSPDCRAPFCFYARPRVVVQSTVSCIAHTPTHSQATACLSVWLGASRYPAPASACIAYLVSLLCNGWLSFPNLELFTRSSREKSISKINVFDPHLTFTGGTFPFTGSLGEGLHGCENDRNPEFCIFSDFRVKNRKKNPYRQNRFWIQHIRDDEYPYRYQLEFQFWIVRI